MSYEKNARVINDDIFDLDDNDFSDNKNVESGVSKNEKDDDEFIFDLDDDEEDTDTDDSDEEENSETEELLEKLNSLYEEFKNNLRGGK